MQLSVKKKWQQVNENYVPCGTSAGKDMSGMPRLDGLNEAPIALFMLEKMDFEGVACTSCSVEDCLIDDSVVKSVGKFFDFAIFAVQTSLRDLFT